MRVPTPLVFLLCTTLIAGLWWQYTRHMDFLTPPASVVAATHLESTQAPVPSPAPVAPPTPTLQPEEQTTSSETAPSAPNTSPELTSPPSITLRQFHTTPPHSSTELANIAAQHEAQKEWQLALLAYERILDESDANEAQRTEAINAIQRIKPLSPIWNADPQQSITIHLHALTTDKHIQTLSPVLNQIAIDIEKASSGILKVIAHVSRDRQLRTTDIKLPYKIYLTGPQSQIPPKLTTYTSSSPLTLKDDIVKNLYRSIGSIITDHQLASPPLNWPPHLDNPSRALYTYVTRHTWQQLGQHLSQPPKP